MCRWGGGGQRELENECLCSMCHGNPWLRLDASREPEGDFIASAEMKGR